MKFFIRHIFQPERDNWNSNLKDAEEWLTEQFEGETDENEIFKAENIGTGETKEVGDYYITRTE